MTYEVLITREGDDWLADEPSVPGAHTFARPLTSLLESVREVVTLMDDLDDDADPELDPTFDIGDGRVERAAEVGR